MPVSLQDVAMYRTFDRSLEHPYKKLDWAKMYDRELSVNDRKKIAVASGQIHPNSGLPPRVVRRLNPTQSKPKAQHTVASVRRNLNIGREMSRDFLTLACYNAIATGQVNILKAIYKTGKAPQVDKNGNTPLHVASKCGQLRSLRWILQHSNIPLLAKNARGETCLHIAALQGHLKCLHAIVLCKKEKPSVIMSERDNLGMTALHHATIGSRERIVQWLVDEFGKDVCLIKSCDGVLAIHLSAAAGNKQCTEILARACKSSVNMSDVFGATPVFYAAQEGHLDCLQYLVESMDGSVKIMAFEGMTAFLSAAEGGHLQVMDYLLDKQGSEALMSTTTDGATVFHYVASIGNAHILHRLLEIPNIADILHVTDVFDRNPAHDAAESGSVECLRLLVEAGISLYLPDKDGETPLSLALRSGNPKCVLFARAIADSTMDMVSQKMLKKKLGSKFKHISGIVTVQALSRDAAVCFKRERKCRVSGRKKMGQYESSHTDYNELLALKQGVQMWPSWHRSLASRRCPRAANRGIFRGEFILLRSSPPGTCAGRDGRRKGNPQNGYLYAQRNRPCPISLPLQKHEYPTRIHQIEAEDELDIDDIERFNHRSPLGLIQEYNGFRQGSREVSLDDIQEEEEEDVDNISLYSRRRASKILNNNGVYEEAETVFSSNSVVDWTLNPSGCDDEKKSKGQIPDEDYSADESGISAHSDSDEKTGYSPSCSDESHKKKCWDGFSDSAMKDSDGCSSMCSDAEVTATVAQVHIPIDKHPPSMVSSDEMSGDESHPISKTNLPDSDDTGLFSISENTDEHGSDEASRERLPRFSLPLSESRSLNNVDQGHTRKWSSTSSSDDETMPNVQRHKSRPCHSNVQSFLRNQNVKPLTSCDEDHLYSEITIVSDADESDAEDNVNPVTTDLLGRNSSRSKTFQEAMASSGSLADIMRLSLTTGSFSNNDKAMPQKKSCNPVFDSSRIKKERQPVLYKQQSITSIKRLSESSDGEIGSPYESSDEITFSNEGNKPKCGQKIKALQDILIKQSLPFANPALFVVTQVKKEEQSPPRSIRCVNNMGDNEPQNTYIAPRVILPGSVPPAPPPPLPPSTLPKVQKYEYKSSLTVRSQAQIRNQTSEKSCPKSQYSDDYYFDGETKTRINSIKSMLQRASNVTERDGEVKTLPR